MLLGELDAVLDLHGVLRGHVFDATFFESVLDNAHDFILHRLPLPKNERKNSADTGFVPVERIYTGAVRRSVELPGLDWHEHQARAGCYHEGAGKAEDRKKIHISFSFFTFVLIFFIK